MDGTVSCAKRDEGRPARAGMAEAVASACVASAALSGTTGLATLAGAALEETFNFTAAALTGEALVFVVLTESFAETLAVGLAAFAARGLTTLFGDLFATLALRLLLAAALAAEACLGAGLAATLVELAGLATGFALVLTKDLGTGLATGLTEALAAGLALVTGLTALAGALLATG